MTANDAAALNNLGFAPGRPWRRVGRVKQPEGLSHGATMVLSDITVGQELLRNDHNGHRYTSGGASLGLRCQACRRRASCQLVGVRIILGVYHKAVPSFSF
jgi:hypothetical protein